MKNIKEHKIHTITWWCFGLGISPLTLPVCSGVISEIIHPNNEVASFVFILSLSLALLMYSSALVTGIIIRKSMLYKMTFDERCINERIITIGLAAAPLAFIVYMFLIPFVSYFDRHLR